ncbi:MAG: AbrB/MazE/SpoVT family DNA-binding domain-containing protein [Thermoplasmata archaeon]
MRQIAEVTRRGQTTIPEEFRRKLSIREGDNLQTDFA